MLLALSCGLGVIEGAKLLINAWIFLLAVVDDDDSGVFTAGAIVTVTVNLRRRPMGEVYEQNLQEAEQKLERQEKEEESTAVTVSMPFSNKLHVFCIVH